MCDRIAIINKGEIITAKTKADLLASAGQKTLHLSLTTPPPLPLLDASSNGSGGGVVRLR